MSGDVVYLQDGPEGRVTDLVRAAAVVAEHAGVQVALIGGLAVMCRVTGWQRATGDVDVVSDTQADVVAGTSAAENLVKAEVADRDPGTDSVGLWVAGTKVEIIETREVRADQAADIEPESDRLFVLGHRWGLDSADQMILQVVDSPVRAEIPVARPAALLTMKLHSIDTRTEDRKRASDAWDIYRLLDTHNRNGTVTAELKAGPDGLADLAAEALDRFFRRDRTCTCRWVVVYGDPTWPATLTEENMSQIAAELVNSI